MKRLAIIFALAALLSACAHRANAQSQDNITGVAGITAAAHAAGTLTAQGTPNTGGKGVYCTQSQTAAVGGTTAQIFIDGEDSFSGLFQELGQSGASNVNTGTGQEILEVYPGAQTGSLPTNTAAYGLKVPQLWRLRLVLTGGTSWSGTASCDFLN